MSDLVFYRNDGLAAVGHIASGNFVNTASQNVHTQNWLNSDKGTKSDMRVRPTSSSPKGYACVAPPNCRHAPRQLILGARLPIAHRGGASETVRTLGHLADGFPQVLHYWLEKHAPKRSEDRLTA